MTARAAAASVRCTRTIKLVGSVCKVTGLLVPHHSWLRAAARSRLGREGSALGCPTSASHSTLEHGFRRRAWQRARVFVSLVHFRASYPTNSVGHMQHNLCMACQPSIWSSHAFEREAPISCFNFMFWNVEICGGCARWKARRLSGDLSNHRPVSCTSRFLYPCLCAATNVVLYSSPLPPCWGPYQVCCGSLRGAWLQDEVQARPRDGRSAHAPVAR